MDRNGWIKNWKAEEEIAHIHGWDFSHIEGRYRERAEEGEYNFAINLKATAKVIGEIIAYPEKRVGGAK